MKVPDGFVQVDTGAVYVCPLTGQLEMPAMECICPDETKLPTIAWACAYRDQFNRSRNDPAFDGNLPQWHQQPRDAKTATVPAVAV